MKTFFFYDLETSGLNSNYDRVMQFAGQRTDMELNPIGKPVNVLVKLPVDILPSPEALIVTGITPQKTSENDMTEAEFAKFLNDEIWEPNTIAVGFNNIRFDDRFIQNILWRNFYDPYEWTWSDNRSRWDILDVVRLVRALRPDGIKWPVDSKGRATNGLELLAKCNKIKQAHAHDALCDVEATIEVAKMLRAKQPKMFEYLLQMRDKREIAKLVNLEDPAPFVYSSGKYDSEFEKTTVAFPIAPGRHSGSVLVYDLRVDPEKIDFSKPDSNFSQPVAKSRHNLVNHPLDSSQELTSFKHPSTIQDSDLQNYSDFAKVSPSLNQVSDLSSNLYPLTSRLPVKELAYNRCPAVAPLGVLDEKSQKRLNLDLKTINNNLEKLEKNRGVIDKIIDIWNSKPEYPKASDVEGQLFDSFTPDSDKPRIRKVRECTPEELADYHPKFDDERLPELLFRYKARNFPQSLSKDEEERWNEYRRAKMERELPGYMNNMAQIAERIADNDQQFILEEIQLWIEANLVY